MKKRTIVIFSIILLLVIVIVILLVRKKNLMGKIIPRPISYDCQVPAGFFDNFSKEAPSQVVIGKQLYVSPQGNDDSDGMSEKTAFKSIQKAVDLAEPADAINLLDGTYLQDIVSRRNGKSDAPITIKGSRKAIVKGGGNDRVIEINHDHIVLEGFSIDGLVGSPDKEKGYRDTLLYIFGKENRTGVTGLRVWNMDIKNAGGECLRLRYFAQKNEIANNTITNCGIYAFVLKAGGKNGEGIYIGTAPEQLKDGKNPTNDPDLSTGNWIHDNIIDTKGNECVDIKESSEQNVVEYNNCTGQKDPESGGMDSRGNNNIFRNNEIYANIGAGIRLGGDTKDQGVGNSICTNSIHDNAEGGIKFLKTPQGKICGNIFSKNTKGDYTGSKAPKKQKNEQCSS